MSEKKEDEDFLKSSNARVGIKISLNTVAI